MLTLLFISVIVGAVCSSPMGKLSFQPSDEYQWYDQNSLGMNGGKKVPISKYPYIVYVLSDKGELFGSGAILNENWVVTTGYTAWLLGDAQIRAGSNTYDKGGQLVKVGKKVVHEKYHWATWSYDVAVYKLQTPLKFNKKVKAIQLGSDPVKPGVTGVVLGLNTGDTSPNHLMALKVTRDTDDNCKTVFGDYYSDTLYCTKSEKVGPCLYDFGDPLVIKNQLYGLYAGTMYNCSDQATPRLYTNIPKLMYWIKHAIES